MRSFDCDYLDGDFYAIADVHAEIGNYGVWAANEFIRQADAPVVMLGDMVEGYRYGNSLQKMLDAGGPDGEFALELLNAGMTYRATCGNHDNSDPIIKTFPPSLWSRDCKIVCTHGQRFDWWFPTSEAEHTADWAGCLAFRLEDLGLISLSKMTRHTRDRYFENRAFEFMADKDINLLITGHTHVPGIWERGNRVLATTGAWSDKGPFSLVEVRNGKPRINQWDGRNLIVS